MRIVILILVISLNMVGLARAEKQPDLFHLRNLLYSHDFDSAEQMLSTYNSAYLEGQSSYRDYHWVYETLWKDDDVEKAWLEMALKKWVQQAPDSAYANAVLGKFYFDKGFDARGGRWSSETSDDQFSGMRGNFKEAFKYLNTGLSKDPNIVFAHIAILNMIKTNSGANITPLSYMDRVPDKVKSQYAIWSHLLQTIVPRWGGSNEEIMHVIDNEVPKYIKNISDQDRQTMMDTITYDQMQMAIAINNEFKKGLKIGKDSIKAKTEYAGVYEIASNGAQQLDDYKTCYKYGKIATQMRPYRGEGWRRYGFCALKLQKWEEANEAYRYKINIDGLSVYSVFQLGVTYMYLHQYDKAYALFKKSEELDPTYPKYTKQYTSWIEADQKDKMNLVGKDIFEMIGSVPYKGATLPE
ncbi:MAG: tetratricopeptide repeat protein [Bdellovibrionales bacterium]